jgi:hypothetical protein
MEPVAALWVFVGPAIVLIVAVRLITRNPRRALGYNLVAALVVYQLLLYWALSRIH